MPSEAGNPPLCSENGASGWAEEEEESDLEEGVVVGEGIQALRREVNRPPTMLRLSGESQEKERPRPLLLLLLRRGGGGVAGVASGGEFAAVEEKVVGAAALR